jgi:glycosyltransferase involved in cell wall biosynthesis
MRVAFFVQYCHEGGTYFRWHNLARALQLQGVVVDVYAGDFNYKAKSRIEFRDGVKYVITPSLITSRIFGNPSDPITALYRWFKTPVIEYEVVHLFQPFLQAFFPWLQYRKRTKFFYDWDDLWTHGIFSKPQNLRDYYTFAIVSYLEKKLPFWATKTTTCSFFLQEKVGVNRTAIITNGYWPRKASATNSSAVFKKENDFFYLGYIGRTAAEIDWLWELADAIENNNLNYKIVIAGINQDQMKEVNLLSKKSVVYLGNLTSEESFVVTGKLDIALMPMQDNAFNQSRFPIKLFDYLTAGVPVYCSAVGMIKPILMKNPSLINGGTNKEDWVNNFFLLSRSSLVELKSQMPQYDDTLIGYQWPEIGKALLSFYRA